MIEKRDGWAALLVAAYFVSVLIGVLVALLLSSGCMLHGGNPCPRAVSSGGAAGGSRCPATQVRP